MSERGALEILVGLDFLGANKGLLVRNGFHALLAQGLECGGILPQIKLGADEDNRDVGRMVIDLRVPLDELCQHLFLLRGVSRKVLRRAERRAETA